MAIQKRLLSEKIVFGRQIRERAFLFMGKALFLSGK